MITMARRHKEWAKRARAELLRILGGKCVACGTDVKLTFDCIKPNGDRHHRMDPSARLCFYRKQHKAGNLQILCDACNTAKAATEWIT